MPIGAIPSAAVIDWCVLIDGREMPGWDARRDGCAFPDDAHQAYLLPLFDVGDVPIDEYGGTEFDAAAQGRLRVHLDWHRSRMEAMPPSWSVTETAGNRVTTRHLHRDKVLDVIDRTLAMLDAAKAVGGTLVFRGD